MRMTDNPADTRLVFWSLAFPVLVALLLRVAAALTLTPHMDEIVSIVVAKQVAATGLPFLPSGILYLQGATLSYLLAPFILVGIDDPGLLRIPGILFGTLSVALCWAFTRNISGSAPAAGLAALLLACDPISVQWSAHVRPYALLQLMTLFIVWRFTHVLTADSSSEARRDLILTVLAFSAGVFTHVSIVMILPALAIATCWRFRDNGARWLQATVFLSTCLFAPAIFLLLNQQFDVSSAGASEAASSVPIIGNHIFDLSALLTPNWRTWVDIYRVPYASDVLPFFALLMSLVLIAAACRHTPQRQFSSAVVFLLSLFWLPVLGIVFLTKGEPRYLMHIHAFELIILATGLWTLSAGLVFASQQHWLATGARKLAPALAIALCAVLLAGTALRFHDRYPSPNFLPAMELVKEQHQPGEAIIVSWPPIAWDTLDSARDDLVFLAGSEQSDRRDRYTRLQPDGRRHDFWAGIPAIVSTHELCTLLRDQPGAWLVLAPRRLNAKWAYSGAMASLVRLTATRSEAMGQVKVWRPVAPDHWPARAERICERAASEAARRAARSQ